MPITYNESLKHHELCSYAPSKVFWKGEKKMSDENEKLDSWNDFISGAFLKAVNVNSTNDAFACINVEIFVDPRDNSERPRLTLEWKDQQFEFDLNKTNAVKAKELGVERPKDLVGKSLYFKKVLVRNPRTNQEVEGLRICKIE